MTARLSLSHIDDVLHNVTVSVREHVFSGSYNTVDSTYAGVNEVIHHVEDLYDDAFDDILFEACAGAP